MRKEGYAQNKNIINVYEILVGFGEYFKEFNP
jgi:hypothetical protein